MIEKILTAFPQVSRAWLMVGAGDMFGTIPESQPQDHTTATPDSSSDSITIPGEVWNVIRQQAASLAAKDAQVDRLISIIEKDKKTKSLPSPLPVTEG